MDIADWALKLTLNRIVKGLDPNLSVARKLSELGHIVVVGDTFAITTSGLKLIGMVR